MKTLVPAAFLRVREKFVPTFLFEDTELSRGAGYLYVYLFSRAYHHGVCRVSQERLAHVGKCCVRSVQNYLRELVELQYLEILRDPDSGRSVYRLLRSPRVLGLIRAAEQAALKEAFFVPGDTQILPEGGANFAPAIKKKEEIYIYPPFPPFPTIRYGPPPTQLAACHLPRHVVLTGGGDIFPHGQAKNGDGFPYSGQVMTPEKGRRSEQRRKPILSACLPPGR